MMNADKFREDMLRQRDEMAFGKFLQQAELGSTWAPAVKETWPVYRRITGSANQCFNEDNDGLQEGETRYWYRTGFANLYMVQVRRGANTEQKFEFRQMDV